MYIYTSVYVHIYIYVYVYIYLVVCICICRTSLSKSGPAETGPRFVDAIINSLISQQINSSIN